MKGTKVELRRMMRYAELVTLLFIGMLERGERQHDPLLKEPLVQPGADASLLVRAVAQATAVLIARCFLPEARGEAMRAFIDELTLTSPKVNQLEDAIGARGAQSVERLVEAVQSFGKEHGIEVEVVRLDTDPEAYDPRLFNDKTPKC